MKYHPRRTKAFFSTLAIVLTAGAQLKAQDFPKYAGGLQLGIAIPTGDLSGGTSLGFNFAITAERNWALSFANRIRLEGTGFSDKKDDSNNKNNEESKTVATAFDLALDFVIRTPKGFYFFVAPAFMALSLRSPAFTDEKDTCPAASGGIGWLFSRDPVNGRATGGWEIKYTHARGFKYHENDFDFSWLTISMVFRF